MFVGRSARKLLDHWLRRQTTGLERREQHVDGVESPL